MMRRKNYKVKICPICQRAFAPTTGKQVYCSVECNRNANKKRHYCKVCGKEIDTNHLYCPECKKKKQKQGVKVGTIIKCIYCGKEFAKQNSGSKTCSKECSRARQLQRARDYDKRKRSPDFTYKNLVGVRVDNRCFVCGGIIPDKNKYNDENYTICESCLSHTKLKIPEDRVYHGKAKNPIIEVER